MKKALSFLLVLTFILCLVLTGCKDKKTTEESRRSETSELSEAEQKTVYNLAAGAASEYELYKSVMGFLNNGFHYDVLKNLYDPILTYACYSKWEEKPERIMTLGMNWQESCDLISRLMNMAENMDFLVEEDGNVDMDYVDFTKFVKEFPSEMQSELNEDNSSFYRFIEDIIYTVRHPEADGENPFGTDQTKWNVLSESEFNKLERQEYDNYNDWDKDLFNNFPRIYMFDIGDHTFDSEYYDMEAYYVEINGRYYLISFHTIVGGIGG